jgi:hypothetical protein
VDGAVCDETCRRDMINNVYIYMYVYVYSNICVYFSRDKIVKNEMGRPCSAYG